MATGVQGGQALLVSFHFRVLACALAALLLTPSSDVLTALGVFTALMAVAELAALLVRRLTRPADEGTPPGGPGARSGPR